MKSFFDYLRDFRWEIPLFFLFCGIFALSFFLYHLPLLAVAYPMLLCGLLGGGFLAVGFRRARKKHRCLAALRSRASEELSALPPAASVIEEDYQALVFSLREQIAALKTDHSGKLRDLNDFYTVWVHQIKTPIAVMQLAFEKEDTPRSRKLRSQLLRIEQYVEMALATSRLDAPSTDYLFREIKIDDLVTAAVRRLAGEFIDRHLTLCYTPVEGTVVTDEKWLGFLLEQVLTNALKYTPTGEIRIFLLPEKRLCIEDTGIGIATEDLPRIFEMGYTGAGGRVDARATGLGLYLCRRISDALGLKLSVTSTPGKGTTVTVDLAKPSLHPD